MGTFIGALIVIVYLWMLIRYMGDSFPSRSLRKTILLIILTSFVALLAMYITLAF